MISSRDQRRIYLLPGRPDQTRNPGLQDILTMVKQDQQSRPMCRQIPIGAAHISFSGQHRMRHPTSKTRPRVSPRWPRSLPSSDQHLDKHWPGGAKIKMTLGLADPRERVGGGEANGKTKVGPCWRSFIQSELSRGSHKSPNRVRNAKSGNIIPI